MWKQTASAATRHRLPSWAATPSRLVQMVQPRCRCAPLSLRMPDEQKLVAVIKMEFASAVGEHSRRRGRVPSFMGPSLAFAQETLAENCM